MQDKSKLKLSLSHKAFKYWIPIGGKSTAWGEGEKINGLSQIKPSGLKHQIHGDKRGS